MIHSIFLLNLALFLLTDSAGTVIDNASVTPLPASKKATPVATTSYDGLFTFEFKTNKDSARVRITAPGYDTLETILRKSPDGSVQRIYMRKAPEKTVIKTALARPRRRDAKYCVSATSTQRKITTQPIHLFLIFVPLFRRVTGQRVLLKRKRVSLVRLGEPGQFTKVSTDTRNRACLLGLLPNTNRWGLFFSILLTGSPGPTEWRLLNDAPLSFHLSANIFSAAISILLNAKSFLPKSLREAPRW